MPETKETLYYDENDRLTTPEKAVRAEIVHRSEAGTVVKVEYFSAVGSPGKGVDKGQKPRYDVQR